MISCPPSMTFNPHDWERWFSTPGRIFLFWHEIQWWHGYCAGCHYGNIDNDDLVWIRIVCSLPLYLLAIALHLSETGNEEEIQLVSFSQAYWTGHQQEPFQLSSEMWYGSSGGMHTESFSMDDLQRGQHIYSSLFKCMHQMFCFCIGLRPQWIYVLVPKTKVYSKVFIFWAFERWAIVCLDLSWNSQCKEYFVEFRNYSCGWHTL